MSGSGNLLQVYKPVVEEASEDGWVKESEGPGWGRLLYDWTFTDGDEWEKTYTGYGLNEFNQAFPEKAKEGLQAAGESIVNSTNAKDVGKNLALNAMGMGGKTMDQVMNSAPSKGADPMEQAFSEAAGKGIGSSITEMVPTSSKFNAITGLGINALGGTGKTMEFAKNKANSWLKSAELSNLDIGDWKEMGTDFGNQFKGSPAARESADQLAATAQGGINDAVGSTFGTVGKGLYQLMSGDFDSFLGTIGFDQNKDDASVNGQAPNTATQTG